jgi:hypothetical protein
VASHPLVLYTILIHGILGENDETFPYRITDTDKGAAAYAPPLMKTK